MGFNKFILLDVIMGFSFLFLMTGKSLVTFYNFLILIIILINIFILTFCEALRAIFLFNYKRYYCDLLNLLLYNMEIEKGHFSP